jgi:N-succinyldiaminopimelate aminotransferase
MLNSRLDRLTDYPFQRLNALLTEPPGEAPVNMTIGEPQDLPPAFVAEILSSEAAGWGKYPPMTGSVALREAIAQWLTRRFGLGAASIDAERHVLALAGSRDGLYQVAFLAGAEDHRRPVALLPNPFYQVYAGAALLAGLEPVFVPAVPETGFLPDFAGLPAEILARARLAYLCNPANPQGAVAPAAYLGDLVALARHYDFILAVDECYAEIYDGEPPPGALAVSETDGFDKVLVFHSLSKRSSAPGLRSGFVAGDARLISAFSRMRAYGGAAIPLPIQAASAALWRDEAHVEASRARYRAKFDAAQSILGRHPGFRRPAGGFFLWLPVGDGEAAAKRLWREAGIRVLPGAYLARAGQDGVNPGEAYLRVALVHDLDITTTALTRLARVLTAEGVPS